MRRKPEQDCRGSKLQNHKSTKTQIDKTVFASDLYGAEKSGLDGFVRFLLENRNKSLWVSK